MVSILLKNNLAEIFGEMEVGGGMIDFVPGEPVGVAGLVGAFVEIGVPD